jgi:hypothetical protein
MSDPVYSPDGKYMWSGSEWIPAPPTSEINTNGNQQSNEITNELSSSVNVTDGVISGDVTINNMVNDQIERQTCRICSKSGFFDTYTCQKCKNQQCENCIVTLNVTWCTVCVQEQQLLEQREQERLHLANKKKYESAKQFQKDLVRVGLILGAILIAITVVAVSSL